MPVRHHVKSLDMAGRRGGPPPRDRALTGVMVALGILINNYFLKILFI